MGPDTAELKVVKVKLFSSFLSIEHRWDSKLTSGRKSGGRVFVGMGFRHAFLYFPVEEAGQPTCGPDKSGTHIDFWLRSKKHNLGAGTHF
jgi:hypothetical protein